MQTHGLQFTHYGFENNTSWETIALPTPTADQALVKVIATAPSSFDLGVQAGDYQWLPIHFPAVLGTEAVGVIQAAGANVEFAPGEVVVGMVADPSRGAYAEAAILDGRSLARLPEGVAADQGLLQLTAVPAYLALFNNGHLQSGEHVLIQGGAGGVGTMAVQLAHDAGATVITTSNASDFTKLQALGADQTLDYHSDIAAQLHAVDLVIDTVGGQVLTDSFAVVRDGGRIVSLVSRPSTEDLVQYPHVSAQFLTASDDTALPKLLRLIADRRLHVSIQQRFALTESGIQAAINYQHSQHVFGRVAIIVGGEQNENSIDHRRRSA